MAKKSIRRPASRRSDGAGAELAGTPMVGPMPTVGGPGGPVETTGRFVVVFTTNGSSHPASVKAALSNVAGLKSVVATSDYEDGAIAAEDVAAAPAVHYEKLGVVVVKSDEAVQALAATASDADSPILAIEPEYLAYPSQDVSFGAYLRGYRDAVNHLFDQLSGTVATAAAQAEAVAASFQDTDQFTWGLQAVGVPTTRFTGQGIKVAILDTGLDLNHPD